MSELARTVSVGLAISLALDEGYFGERCLNPVANMVMLRYPPQASTGEGTGCGSHTDCGFLTILAQDRPGLQICLPSGEWVQAPVIPGTFIVNLGDMAHRWTSGFYKSTQHAVANVGSETRHSIAFFSNCDYDAVVEAIPCTFTRGRQAHPPVTAGEYISEKLGLMYEGNGSGVTGTGAGTDALLREGGASKL
jgi:isopenicillin N synthase-like dioxygenase